MGKRKGGLSVRTSPSVPPICSLLSQHRWSQYLPLSGRALVSPPFGNRLRIVFVENQHVKLSLLDPRSAEQRRTVRRRDVCLPTLLPWSLARVRARLSVAFCQIPIWLPSSVLRPRAVSPVRRVSHTSHPHPPPPLSPSAPPPPPPPPPSTTRLMVVEGHIRIPGDGRKKC